LSARDAAAAAVVDQLPLCNVHGCPRRMRGLVMSTVVQVLTTDGVNGDAQRRVHNEGGITYAAVPAHVCHQCDEHCSLREYIVNNPQVYKFKLRQNEADSSAP
jgi:hypothetical protein